jgi:hypothetical protein
MRTPPIKRALAPLALAFSLSVVAAASAEAQLGTLRRAAERRVNQKAEDRVAEASLIEPTFDETTVEITADRLDKYQAAMERRKSRLEQNRAAYEALGEREHVTRDSADKADNRRDRDAYEAALSRYRTCRSGVEDGIRAEAERKGQELAMKAQSNPAAVQNDPKMREMMAMIQEISAAQARGDTAAMQAAMQKFSKSMGGATDSVSLDRAAVTKCGARPARPASMMRADQLRERADSLGRAQRGMQSGSNGGVSGSEVGMSDRAARMFWERVASWLTGMRDSAPITKTFSKSEYNLLLSRRDALRKAWSGS